MSGAAVKRRPARIGAVRPKRWAVSDAGAGFTARYDAAQTNSDNSEHWMMADNLSAPASLSPFVRRRIRSRARYEVANNPYARGIVSTYVNDVVGVGPRLQMQTQDSGLNSAVEAAWAEWWRAIGGTRRLATAVQARLVDGEVGVLSLASDKFAPGLDLLPIEADRIARHPLGDIWSDEHDGIEIGPDGRPIAYHVLRRHPGSIDLGPNYYEVDRFPAAQFAHMFRADRPGQTRGVSELVSALGYLADLRRYELAVLGAAETAASSSAVIYSDAPAFDEAEDDAVAFEEIELPRRAGMVLPRGYKIGGFNATHPTTNHTEYVRHLIVSAARCINMPAVVALGDASGYNYSSGRLDLQTYDRTLRKDRAGISEQVLDAALRTFLAQAQAIGIIPESDQIMPSHQWLWQGRGHVDPAKEANAAKVRLDAGLTTLARIAGEDGDDWEEVAEQRSRENERLRELGLAVPGAPATQPAGPAPDDDEQEAEE